MAFPDDDYGVGSAQYQFTGFGGGFGLTLGDVNHPDVAALVAYIDAAMTSLHSAVETGESIDVWVYKSYTGGRTDEFLGF